MGVDAHCNRDTRDYPMMCFSQDIVAPLQAFAKETGLPGAKVPSASDTADLPAASEAYVKRIKARLEAVDGKCGVELVWEFIPRFKFWVSPVARYFPVTCYC